MRERGQLLPILVLAACLCIGSIADGGETARKCDKLDHQVAGPAKKYSMTADVSGFAAFDDIGCSIEWRNRELCATELASFDITARVFDFLTGRELEMAKAYFVVNESAPGRSKIIAFAAKQDAEKYAAGHSAGTVIDFTTLTGLEFD